MNAPKQKFLIIKLSSIGDIVHALPFLRSLREHHPNAHIAWMVEESFQELLECNSDLDEVIPVRIKHWRKNLSINSWREISKIRQLLKGTKLSWNDNCLKFHNKKRPIKTASDVQARKKIYKSSMNSWKKYKKFLRGSFKKI